MPLTEYAAESGEQLATEASTTPPPAEPPVAPQLAVLALDEIAPSRTNPRKHFDQAKLAELAASIAASGVHQPILVRPLPASRMADTFESRAPGARLPSYELIAGERRWRACRMAGVEQIPVIVRQLTDHQVLEAQIVENLQRDDLTALEEAEGYQALIEATGVSKDAIGERIGRSRTYVYGRLKLLDLVHDAREALREGKIDASIGLLIARIPNQKLQIKALKQFGQEDYRGDKPSVRAARSWIEMNVMIRLAEAPFDIARADLVPAAGSCQSCSKRTGAAPELFSDFDAPDLCTDQVCFESKRQAHVDEIADKARARGVEVIEGKEALEIKPSRWGGMRGYQKVDVRVDDDDGEGSPSGVHTLRDVLTREERGQIKLLIDPHGDAPIEVLPEAVADAALERLASQQRQTPEQRRERAELEKDKRAAAAHTLAKKHAQLWRGKALPALLRAAVDERRVQALSAAVMRVVLRHVAMSEDLDLETLARAFGVEELDWGSLQSIVATTPDIDLGPRLLAVLLVSEAESVDEWDDGHRQLQLTVPAVMLDVAQSVGIDLQPYQDEAREALREEYEALEPQKKKSATSSEILYRGQAGETWSGRGKQPKWVEARLKQGATLESLRVDQAAAPSRGRKGKTSAAVAAASIAQALQALPEGTAR